MAYGHCFVQNMHRDAQKHAGRVRTQAAVTEYNKSKPRTDKDPHYELEAAVAGAVRLEVGRLAGRAAGAKAC